VVIQNTKSHSNPGSVVVEGGEQPQAVVETDRGSKIKSMMVDQSVETSSIISIVDLNPVDHRQEEPSVALEIYKPSVKKKVLFNLYFR
jgi:hypothetical protein